MSDALQSTEYPRASAPVFDSTIVLDGAARAILSVTWVWNRTTKESHLVLAMVDLVPDEMPLIDRSPPWCKPLSEDWTVYCESDELKSVDAVTWYDALVRDGTWTPPWPNPHSGKLPRVTQPILLSDTLNEPRWPQVITLRNSHAVPFAARRGAGTRLHHLLSESPRLAAALSPEELRVLSTELDEWLDIDLSKTPELWQSAHFFQPLPFLRHLSMRRDTSGAKNEDAVFIDIVPRKGVGLECFTIEVLETRPSGQRLLSRIRPTAPFYQVQLTERVEQVMFRVYHSDAGLLLEEGPYTFLGGFNLSMAVFTRERRVPVPQRGERPATVMRIPVAEPLGMNVGSSNPAKAAARILWGVHFRLDAAAKIGDRQTWFNGDPGSAQEVIQKLLSGAKRRAILVDPYFAGEDVNVWLPSVASHNAEVQVLTSSLAFRNAVPGQELRGQDREREHLQRFEEALATAVREKWINTTAVRIMQGTSPIHDRFLVVDDAVWLLGSSLNDFGKRGTMLVALPQPGEVLPELERAWAEAIPLARRMEQFNQKEPAP